jgi:hypothetical protein
MRRKYERRLTRQWMPWGNGHPVARAMASGDSWFRAWQGQAAVVWPVIERRTGIGGARLYELDRGAVPTADELTALAVVWGCALEDLKASLDQTLREK